MENRRCEVRFTRLFPDDLTRAADYITDVLGSPDAALRLMDETEQAIHTRAACAESFEPYPESKKRRHPYYRIYVGHYTVFYVVIDGVMEVRRFLYSARDLPRLL